jgi:hypothetical protein
LYNNAAIAVSELQRCGTNPLPLQISLRVPFCASSNLFWAAGVTCIQSSAVRPYAAANEVDVKGKYLGRANAHVNMYVVAYECAGWPDSEIERQHVIEATILRFKA